MVKFRFIRWLFVLSLVAILGSGCVYFNTFFNAKRKFNEAEETQKKNRENAKNMAGVRPGGRPIPGSRPGGTQPGGRRAGANSGGVSQSKVTPQVKLLYEDCIKKASKVLKFHPESKYVDDALWMIGKSYYNMGDYLLADRKFQELVINHPDSKYADDSYFYSGLCQIELGNEDQAQKSFARLESNFKKSKYIDDVYFARGSIDKKSGDCAAAIDQFAIYLKQFPKGDSAAKAVFLTGQCKEELGDYYGAYVAYSKVEKHNPDNQLYFDAKLASATAILKTDSLSLGMEILQDLAKNERYFDYSSEIRLRIADGYYRQGEIQKAVDEYKNVTVQSPRSDESAEAYYHLGLIYQNDLFDIVKAKEAFASAQSESPNSGFRTLALSRSAQIAKLESYRIQLQRADSLKMAEEQKPDSTLVNTEPAVDSGSVAKPPDTLTTAIAVPDSNGNVQDTLATADTSQVHTRSYPEIAAGDMGDFIGPLPESLYLQINMMAGKTPEKDSSKEVINPPPVNEDSLRAVEAARQDSVRKAIIRSGIETRFMLAELYAYDLNRPDSALNEYLLIVSQHPESPYAPKSLLAAANIEFARSDTGKADGYLKRIVEEYPRTPQAVQAAEILKYPLNLSNNAIGLYAKADSLIYYYDKPDSAISLFRYIADNFPDLAPKARFAIAWTLDNIKNVTDSSAYYAYTTVNNEYPETEYAQAAKVKLGMVARPHVTRPKNPDEQGYAQQQDSTGANPDSLKVVAGLQEAPPVVKKGEFLYPEELLDRDLKGEVTFKVRIDVTGRVQDYEIIGPSGQRAIDSVATAALLATEFDTSNMYFSQLDSYFRYSIPFEKPKIDIFNDPYRDRRDQEGH